MQRDPRAYLWDAREAALAIQAFTAGMDATAYSANATAQSAVERKFGVKGQSCLLPADPAALAPVFIAAYAENTPATGLFDTQSLNGGPLNAEGAKDSQRAQRIPKKP